MRTNGLVATAIITAAFFVSPAATAAVLITIDKAAQQMNVSIDGVTRYRWPVSTGRGGYTTPSGAFKPFRLEEDHYSKEWDEAPMPNSIFFTTEGHAIHGSFETKRLGTPASHGCVRLAPQNAAILFNLVKTEGLNKTRVVLGGETPSTATASARRQQPVQQLPNEQARVEDPRNQQPYYGGWYARQPQYGQTQYGQPAYAQPQYGQPQYGQTQYGPPNGRMTSRQPVQTVPVYGEPAPRRGFLFFGN